VSIPALISVVVPAKNEERDLGACLAGVSRRDCEVVVVDDGSTDRSAAVAEEAGARVILQPGLGPAAARNRGVKEARGDVILFLDADCRVGPTWVEQLSTPIREGRADVTVGPYLSDQENWVARLVQLELEQR
jgi:glycosyltransferase involved in cell wall biosynthesis